MAMDLAGGIRRWRFAFTLAYEETFSGVRGTLLGPLWLLIQPLIWVVTMVLLVQPSHAIDAAIYPTYVAAGVVLYTAIQSLMSGGTQIFTRDKSVIQNVPLPLSLFALKHLARTGIEMVIGLPVVIGALIYSGVMVSERAIMILPSVPIFLCFALGIVLFLGTLAARLPDLVWFMQAIMRVMLFVTPVFWVPDDGGSVRLVVAEYNPLYHLIEVVRDPILGIDPQPVSYLVSVALALAVLVVGLLTFARYRGRIPIWL